jgi:hypothetical protein
MLNKRHYTFLSNYIFLGFHREQGQGIITNMWCATAAPPVIRLMQHKKEEMAVHACLRHGGTLHRGDWGVRLDLGSGVGGTARSSGPTVQEDERAGEPDRSLPLSQDLLL